MLSEVPFHANFCLISLNGHNGTIDVAGELSQGFPFTVYVHAHKP
jgi:hypothetical protein